MTNANIHIRKCESQDAALYRDIRLESLQQVPEAFGSTFEVEQTYPLSWFEERVQKTVIYGAFQDNMLQGVAGFYVQQGMKIQHKGVLWGLYVRPEARGNHLGPALVQAIISHAQSCVEILQLTVVSSNAPALRLYERCGFEVYGLEKHALKDKDTYVDEVLMARKIKSFDQ